METLGCVPPARCLTESGWGGRAQGASIDSWEAGACGRSLLIMPNVQSLYPCTVRPGRAGFKLQGRTLPHSTRPWSLEVLLVILNPSDCERTHFKHEHVH